jgi:hypothetical protein
VGGISLTKAYGASIAIGLAALLVSLGFRSAAITLGLLAGTALALGILASLEFIVSRAMNPKAPRRGLAIALGLVKLPVAAAIVWALVGRDLVSGPAFALGFMVPQVAIALLAVGGRAAVPPDPGGEGRAAAGGAGWGEVTRTEAGHAAPRA